MRAAALLFGPLLALGACAATPEPTPVSAPAAAPPSAPEPMSGPPRQQGVISDGAADPAPVGLAAPDAVVVLAVPYAEARPRVEALAVQCWLDDELAAEALLVNNRTGEMVAAGGTGELLRIAFLEFGSTTEVQMAGPALADAARAGRMTDALGRVLEGEEPAC